MMDGFTIYAAMVTLALALAILIVLTQPRANDIRPGAPIRVVGRRFIVTHLTIKMGENGDAECQVMAYPPRRESPAVPVFMEPWA
jgi:hypothetical protein